MTREPQDRIRYSELTRSSLYDAHGRLHVNERRVDLEVSGDVAGALVAAGAMALIGGVFALAASSQRQSLPRRSAKRGPEGRVPVYAASSSDPPEVEALRARLSDELDRWNV